MKSRHLIFVRSLVTTLAVMLILAIWACRNGGDSGTDTAADTASDTASSSSSSTGTAPAKTKSMATGSGSEIYVDFKGTESFVFPTDTAVPARLVIIDGGSSMQHDPIVVLPVDTVTTSTNVESDLKTIFKAKTVNCMSQHACVVTLDPQAPVAMRIVDDAGNPPTPALTRTARFDSLVPHLKNVSAQYGSAELSDLDPALSTTSPNPYPPAGKDYTAFFEMNGGELDATPACGRAAFVNTDTSKTDLDFEPFANRVVWMGKTAGTARLQVARDEGGRSTGWQDVKFGNASFVHIMVFNEPRTSGVSDHFVLHARVGHDKNGHAVTLPGIDHRQDCEPINKSNVIGCSDTQWP